MTEISKRREFLKLGMGGAVLAGAAGIVALSAQKAAAQSAPDSLLRTIIDRGHLIVGTGSTNAPWHFEDDAGKLVGMDITMARILAKGLFDDETKVEFVLQDPAQRIPNIVTGKVDITIQFMTMSANRAQLVAFPRPYYVEGVSLLSSPNGKMKSFDELTGRWCQYAHLDPAERRRRRGRTQGAARSAGDADRHSGQRHCGAGSRSRRWRGSRPLDSEVARCPQSRKVCR